MTVLGVTALGFLQMQWPSHYFLCFSWKKVSHNISNWISSINSKKQGPLKIQENLSHFTERVFTKVYIHSSTFDTYVYFKIERWPSKKHLTSCSRSNFCMTWKGIQYSPDDNLTVLLKKVLFYDSEKIVDIIKSLALIANKRKYSWNTRKEFQKLPNNFNIWYSQNHGIGRVGRDHSGTVVQPPCSSIIKDHPGAHFIGECPDDSWISSVIETPQPLQAICMYNVFDRKRFFF